MKRFILSSMLAAMLVSAACAPAPKTTLPLPLPTVRAQPQPTAVLPTFAPAQPKATTAPTAAPAQSPSSSRTSINELKGPRWRDYVGQTVSVEGIFVRDPVPLLVTDLTYVLVNSPMPGDQYIRLTGPESEDLNPENLGGARLLITGKVVAWENPAQRLQEAALAQVKYILLDRPFRYAPKILDISKMTCLLARPHSYAVLFSGGIDEINNHIRYWNDLKFMYHTLVNRLCFPAKNITVLYADGKGRDSTMTVDYSATLANLQSAFGNLRPLTTSQDLVFVFTTNHGGGFSKGDKKASGGRLDTASDEPTSDTLSEATYNLDLNNDSDKKDSVAWDEELYSWGGDIYDDDFRSLYNNLKYDRLVIVMEQCFSGGLIFDARGSNRIIISAAGEYEPSWAMPPAYDFDEFSYHFTSALNEADHQAKAVKADTNNDGHVSLVEAFNYSRSKDTQSETPWYDDSGDGIAHSGNMPAGGDGTIGGSLTLR